MPEPRTIDNMEVGTDSARQDETYQNEDRPVVAGQETSSDPQAVSDIVSEYGWMYGQEGEFEPWTDAQSLSYDIETGTKARWKSTGITGLMSAIAAATGLMSLADAFSGGVSSPSAGGGGTDGVPGSNSDGTGYQDPGPSKPGAPTTQGAINSSGSGTGSPGQGALNELQPDMKALWLAVKQRFPGVTFMGGKVVRNVAGTSTPSQHSYGNAIDIGGTPETMLAVANWIAANAGSLGVGYLIFNMKDYSPSKGWGTYWYKGSDPNMQHRNHVHVQGPKM